MRKHALTIALVALALGLGVFLLVDRGRPSDEEKRARTAKLVEAWRREDVTALELAVGGKKVRVERVGDQASGRTWRMLQPEDGPCDASVVDRTLSALENAHPLRSVTAGSATGLDQPRAQGSVSMGRATVRFKVGAAAPTPEGASYFQIDGKDPVVISRDLATELTKAADAYRDRNLATLRPQDVTKLVVSGELGPLVVVRHGRGFVEATSRVRVPRGAMDRVWHGYADLRAESFLDAPPKEETSKVEITAAHGELVTLRIGGPCAEAAQVAVERIAAARSVSACVPRGAVTAFELAADDRVDRRLFHARPDELVELTMEAGAEKLDLARKESGFRVRSPGARDLDLAEADAATVRLAWIASQEARSVSRRPSVAARIGEVVLHAAEGDETIAVFADHRLLRQDDGAWLEPADDLFLSLTRPLELIARAAVDAGAGPDAPPRASGDR